MCLSSDLAQHICFSKIQFEYNAFQININLDCFVFMSQVATFSDIYGKQIGHFQTVHIDTVVYTFF